MDAMATEVKSVGPALVVQCLETFHKLHKQLVIVWPQCDRRFDEESKASTSNQLAVVCEIVVGHQRPKHSRQIVVGMVLVLPRFVTAVDLGSNVTWRAVERAR